MALPPPSPVLSEAQNGDTVAVSPGAQLEVRLGSNPSTGYSWQVVRGPPAVVVVRRSYRPAPQQPGLPKVGAPGREVLDLHVLARPGEAAPLVLAYKPPGRALVFGRIWRVRLRVVEPPTPASEASARR